MNIRINISLILLISEHLCILYLRTFDLSGMVLHRYSSQFFLSIFVLTSVLIFHITFGSESRKAFTQLEEVYIAFEFIVNYIPGLNCENYGNLC